MSHWTEPFLTALFWRWGPAEVGEHLISYLENIEMYSK